MKGNRVTAVKGTIGLGHGGKVPECRVVNGWETLGRPAPSVVTGHESYGPDSDYMIHGLTI